MGSQRKCWRRSQISLSGCERGEWGQESSEFMTCVREAPCKPQGQSCENSGDCCENDVCQQLLGGKVCAAPPCKPQGQSCENNGDCCDKNVCKQLFGGDDKVCAPPHSPSCVALGDRCSPTCPGCPVQQCCEGSTCQKSHAGDDFFCVS